MWRSCLGLQLANRCMRVLFIGGGGLHEGIRVFQEGICIPFQVLVLRFKKKQLTFQNVKESAYCSTLGEKKNHSKPCEHLFNAFVQITSYARFADLSIGSTSHFLYCPPVLERCFLIVL